MLLPTSHYEKGTVGRQTKSVAPLFSRRDINSATGGDQIGTVTRPVSDMYPTPLSFYLVRVFRAWSAVRSSAYLCAPRPSISLTLELITYHKVR